MRYPYVESSAGWDYRSIYYRSDHPQTGEKADVGSHRLLYADVIRDITALAGDVDDMVDAILYWVAYQATCDMRISVTKEVLTSVASLWDIDIDQAFSARLVYRAGELMSGVALVGALRAIAWHLGEQAPSAYRSKILALARGELERSGAISGKSSLVADDAHAHLAVAGRLRPGVEDLQAELVLQGTYLLGAAHALMLLEPWNPFVRSRLRAEMGEHEEMLNVGRGLHGALGEAVDTAVSEMEMHYESSTRRFDDHLANWGQHQDLAAFFFNRRDAFQGLALDGLSATTQQFVNAEPEVARLI